MTTVKDFNNARIEANKILSKFYLKKKLPLSYFPLLLTVVDEFCVLRYEKNIVIPMTQSNAIPV